MPPTLDQKWSKNEGLILDPLLGSFWDPLGAKNSLKRLPRGVSRGVRRETPKHGSFWTPPERPKVSSRLGGSTVFHIWHGSFLDPVLDPFWLRFGGHLEPNAAQKASQGTPRFWVSFWSQNGSQTVFVFSDLLGSRGPPEPPWSRFAAGTLRAINFDPFWLRLERQMHGLGPLAVPISYPHKQPLLAFRIPKSHCPSFEKTPLRALVVPACIVKH